MYLATYEFDDDEYTGLGVTLDEAYRNLTKSDGGGDVKFDPECVVWFTLQPIAVVTTLIHTKESK